MGRGRDGRRRRRRSGTLKNLPLAHFHFHHLYLYFYFLLFSINRRLFFSFSTPLTHILFSSISHRWRWLCLCICDIKSTAVLLLLARVNPAHSHLRPRWLFRIPIQYQDWERNTDKCGTGTVMICVSSGDGQNIWCGDTASCHWPSV